MIFRPLWFWQLLLLVLCFLAPAQTSSSIQHTIVDCKNASKVVLGKNNQTITYRSKEYNTNCAWTIPKSVQTNEYAVVLLLENVTLPKPPEGCSGSIRFPKTGEYRCEFMPHYCLAYATSATQCDLEKINQKALQTYKSSCENFTYWTSTETAKLEYHAANQTDIYKEIVFHYIPINCIERTTAPAHISGNIEHTIVDCKNASKVALSKNEQMFTYRSKEYNKHCAWTIPKSVQTDEYAVVLLLENVTLPNFSVGCSGSIRFPKIGGYKCEFTSHFCLAYVTSTTRCDSGNIVHISLQKYTSPCKKFTHWTSTETAKLEYFAANNANIHKEFVLHYIPINCIEQTTITTTTTSTTTTTPRTTTTTTKSSTTATTTPTSTTTATTRATTTKLSTTRTSATKTATATLTSASTTIATKSSTTGMSATTAASSMAKTDSIINSKSTTLKSSTEPQAQAAFMIVAVTGLVVGATALFLAIGHLLHRKRIKQHRLQHPEILERDVRKTDEIELYEECDGNIQQNEAKNKNEVNKYEAISY